MRRIAIVGMSLAGLRAAETLRRDGFDGRIVAIGAEPHLPYDRPPLSKELLAGRGRTRRRRAAQAGRRRPRPRLAARARARSRSTLADRRGRARRRRARRLRRADHRDRFVAAPAARCSPTSTACSRCARSTTRSRSAPSSIAARRVVVIGAGFIGAEVAGDVPAARARGHDPRGAAAPDGARPRPRARRRHRRRAPRPRRRPPHQRAREGHRRRTAASSACGSATARRSTRISSSSASASSPRRAGSKAAGSRSTTAIVCDATVLAAPGVVAAGDVARWPNLLFDGQVMRLEHWTNATEQGVHAAKRLLAGEHGAPFAPVPFVWSDQYDRKIQTVGMVAGDARRARRARHARRPPVRRAVRPRRPHHRRARVQPAPPRDAVPPADQRTGVVGRRARPRQQSVNAPRRRASAC